MAATHPPADTLPATLLAIAIAARRGSDRGLELVCLRRLREEHGVRVSFCRPAPAVKDRPPAKGGRDGR